MNRIAKLFGIMKFDPLKENFSIPSAEEKILEFWEKNDVFHKSLAQREGKEHFVFYEGPPTANGRPGIHHIGGRTIKDLICRYKAMRGFRVDRKGGWDTHGLPVEIEVEKQLGLESKAGVLEYGIEKFNQQCRKSVFKYLEDWNNITRRIGYWLDLDDAYVTLKNEYIESVWWILKNFWDRDLIYLGHRTVPFCPSCGTGLSSHEVAQGYDLIKDPSIYVKFKAADEDFFYLVWTTTPWTLPSNAALCFSPDADYALVEHEGEKLLLAEALIGKVFGEEKEILKRFKGKDFVGRKFEPLFDFYKSEADKAFFVVTGDFVTMDDGTGIVHIAPGFGADDYEIGKQHNLPVLQAIEPNGHFKEIAGKYADMYIKDADKEIIKDLKIEGKLFKKELYEHNYPFCWRCDSPLIYIARKSWYIRTTQFRDQLLKNNNSINWYPDEVRSGRMADWLENNVDWALSRERFWGTPLPIWVCEDESCGKMRAVGSIEQLKKEAINCPEEVDLHKPMMDEVQLKCECGKSMNRVPEVIDVWFDAGSMPLAQWHYPFENEEEFEAKFPAAFISEAIDQTRGWFYTLLAISTLLFDKAPFENVIVQEFILDKEGKKMSKHKGNVVDPFATVDQYGADPLRWYMMVVSNPWLPTKFDLEGLKEVIRKYFDTLRNTHAFFVLYANIDNILPRAEKAGMSVESFLESKAGPEERFDRWIISKYNSLVKSVTKTLDEYDITRTVRTIQQVVIDDLSNWYVRNNRRRFWAKDDDPSKMRAYLTLYRLLTGICRLTAPITPFISELIWKELQGENREKFGAPLSVHLTDYPSADESAIDKALEETMSEAESIVSLGRAARSRRNLKVRQPLARLMVSLPGQEDFDRLLEYFDIIKDELNIKEIVSADALDEYIDYSAKLNFKTAGPKLGNDVKNAAQLVSSMTSAEIQQFVRDKQVTIELDGHRVVLTDEEIMVVRGERDGYAIESDGRVTIALTTAISDDLREEGYARELVNKIQNMRKSTGLEVTDSILVRLSSSDKLISAARHHEDFICRETLASRIEVVDESNLSNGQEWNINGEMTNIEVAKT
ncbi:MAG: isoleucine--tRNA ligase [bacterium]|nr:isoleucine--tRNA ligase [bacterium]